VNDKDSKLIFENYMQNVNEAPIGPGSSWEDEDIASQFDKGELDKLSKYKVSDPVIVNQIAAELKEFISDHEGKIYPGTVKDFKNDIIDTVRSVADIGSANGKYAARVLSNTLARLDFIDIDGATQQVKVDDNIDTGKVETAVKDTVESIVAIQLRKDYEIGAESGQTPDSEADKAYQILKREIGAGWKSTGKNIIDVLRSHLSLEVSKALANTLLQTDGIILPETEADEEKEIDMGSDVDSVDDRYAAQDYASQYFGNLGGGGMNDY
jgi:hypothetical protein